MPKNAVVVSAAVTGVVPIRAALAKLPPGALVVSTRTTVEFATCGKGVGLLLGVAAGVPVVLGDVDRVTLPVNVPVPVTLFDDDCVGETVESGVLEEDEPEEGV